MALYHFNQQGLEKAVSSGGLVMVDMWAPWCAPCRMLGPTVEKLAEQYDGKAVIGKLNTDENQQLAMQLGIMGIPCVIFFKDGRESTERWASCRPRRIPRYWTRTCNTETSIQAPRAHHVTRGACPICSGESVPCFSFTHELKHGKGGRPCRQLKEVFQCELFGLGEELQVGHETGGGGGIFAQLSRAQKLKGLVKADLDLIGVPVPEGHVEIGVLGEPLVSACRMEHFGPAVFPGEGQRFGLDKLAGQRSGEGLQMAGVPQGSAHGQSEQGSCDPKPFQGRRASFARK